MRNRLEAGQPAPGPAFRFDYYAGQKLQITLFGNTLISGDIHQRSDLEVVRGHRTRRHVWTELRAMRDPLPITIHPQCHRSNRKIRVSVFPCVLAPVMCALL